MNSKQIDLERGDSNINSLNNVMDSKILQEAQMNEQLEDKNRQIINPLGNTYINYDMNKAFENMNMEENMNLPQNDKDKELENLRMKSDMSYPVNANQNVHEFQNNKFNNQYPMLSEFNRTLENERMKIEKKK